MALDRDPNHVLRDFVIPGMPSSGKWNPRKPEMRALFTEWWQTLIALVADAGGLELPNLLIRMTVTGGDQNNIVAEANLPVPSGPGAAVFSIVIEEANTGPVTINGKPLLSNTGNQLVAKALLPDGVYLFVDDGDHYRLISGFSTGLIRFEIIAGDANSIVAEANAALPAEPGLAVFSIVIEEPNTGPVTINGKPLLSNTGNPLVAGALAAAGIYLFLDNGDSYRLLSDQATSALVAAAEAAEVRALDAAARAEIAAASVESPAYEFANRFYLGAANNKIMMNSGGETLRIVCVGDSITYGYDNNSPDALDPISPHVTKRAPIQYPARLGSRLSTFLASNVSIENRGFSGDTAEDSYNRWTDNPNADLAIIMFGINDSSEPISTYIEYTEKLIKRYIDWGCGVMLITPTPISMGNGDHVSSRYGQYARALAASYGCPVMEGMEPAINAIQPEVYSDPTHFNASGYAKVGDAVASFLMSGALVREPRKISSETFVSPGRASEGIGVRVKNGTLSGNLSASFVLPGSICSLAAGSGIMAVSFYLDAEAAEVSTTGLLSTGTRVAMCEPYDGKGVNRGALKAYAGRQIKETEPYTLVSVANRRNDDTQLGVVVGRGWKTITIDAADASASSFVHGLTIRPVMQKEAFTDGSEMTPAREEAMVFHIPSQVRGGAVSVVSTAVMPQHLLIPMPNAMQSWAGLDGHYHWMLPVTVRVKRVGASPVGVSETAVVKSGSSANGFNLYSVFNSGGAMAPIGATFGWCNYQDDPVEYADLTLGSYPGGGGNVLRFLVLEFPTEPPAYHTVEVLGLSRRGAPFTALN